MSFVLYDRLTKSWFREWTGIGPCCTKDKREAARFRTKDEARNSPAYLFPMTFFEPQRTGPVAAARRREESGR